MDHGIAKNALGTSTTHLDVWQSQIPPCCSNMVKISSLLPNFEVDCTKREQTQNVEVLLAVTRITQVSTTDRDMSASTHAPRTPAFPENEIDHWGTWPRSGNQH